MRNRRRSERTARVRDGGVIERKAVPDDKKRLNWTLTEEEAERLRATFDQRSTRELTVTDLDVVFQPVVDLTVGKLRAVEALVRCKWPEYANPEALIERAVSEESIGRLGRQIREVAFERCRDIPMFINVHPHELTSRWLVRPDDPICFHGNNVFIEITESAAFEYFDMCSSVLKEICSRTGAKLVIDDLGAGYSNLKRVVDLQPDVVKIDRALVSGLHENRRQRVLFQHVVRMCKELGARVVAEGIETVDELKAVRDGGAEFGQGFLLARPGYPIPTPVWPSAASTLDKEP